MAVAEPNRMPAFEEAAASEMLRHSLISVDISDHPRGSNFPAFIYEPRKVAIERNGASIADPRRADPHHVAPDNTAADASPVGPHFDIQFDLGTRQQAMVCLDEGTVGGHVNQSRAMSGTN